MPVRRAVKTSTLQQPRAKPYAEPFECDVVCRDRAGAWDDDRRAERGCRRIDLPLVPDRIQPQLLMVGYMGRPAEPGLTEVAGRPVNPQLPLENPEEGCPGAWGRCRFVLSLVPYLRRRTEGGGRVPNRRLDRCDDEFIWDCVALVEAEQERHLAHSTTTA